MVIRAASVDSAVGRYSRDTVQSPYSAGDKVRIYLDPVDPGTHTHGTVCEVVDVLAADLDIQTDRPTDAYSYMLRKLETGETLPLAFRRPALAPAENTH